MSLLNILETTKKLYTHPPKYLDIKRELIKNYGNDAFNEYKLNIQNNMKGLYRERERIN